MGSGKDPLSYSKLVSPVYETGNSNECLLFWYNMHGPDVQTFDINIVEKGTGKRTTIWSQQGDQGVGWRKVSFVFQLCYDVDVILESKLKSTRIL